MHTKETYDAVSKAFRAGKSVLTRARNKKDWAKMKKVCEETLAKFEDHGLYPDDWAIIQNGLRDAEWELRRAGIEFRGE